ncbi:PAS domain-containing protein [Sarocladium implicatum]|nr:PAS domain-containing protein [Sarocladium implicatum]
MASKTPPLAMNPWETRALDYEFPVQQRKQADGTVVASTTWRQVQDPVIYPGLYSATGFDMMSILLQVIGRPHPTIELGPVDCSVALIMCDLHQSDCPIVYASDSFCDLTGYSMHEVLGRNCRFLQIPPGRSSTLADAVQPADKVAIHRMRQAVQTRSELQLELTNYKKNGTRFTNALSIIPVTPNGSDYRYIVGFQVELN